MRIKRVSGELFKYWVSSRTEREWHVVDLTERSGHGVCTCAHFRFVANPNFRRLNVGRRAGDFRCMPYGRDEPTECAHIALAQRVVTERFMKRIQSSCRSGAPQWVVSLWSALTGEKITSELQDEAHSGQEADDDTDRQ